jgi:hypothetical protein
VNQLNCFDKSLLAFEVNCTGQRIGYSGIFYLKGEPDADRLRKAILSTARARPDLMTTLCGGPLWLCRGLHEEFVEEVLGVSYLSAPQAQQGLVRAGIGKHLQMPTGSRIEISQLSRSSRLLY